MKWLERLEKKQVHDDWVESFDWGTRCLICGNATTIKRKQFWRTVDHFAAWCYDVLGFSLLLSAGVLAVMLFLRPINYHYPGPFLDLFWVLLYGFCGMMFLYQRHVAFPEEAN